MNSLDNEEVTYAVAYCRFSSNNQREESIDAQLRAIKQYAEDNKMILLKAYCDSATTGTNADRKEFLQMISDAKKKEFKKVIVHKMDRFARNKYDSFGYKLELAKHDVKVISVLERIDDSPEGSLLEGLLDNLADFYSKNLSRETMKGMKENAYNSKYNGSKPPFGYKLIPRTDEYGNILYSKRRGSELHDLAIDEHNAIAVRKIFDMTLERKPYSEICQYLNDNNYRTTSGGKFTSSNLLCILRNERYTGTYIYNQYRKVRSINGKYSKAKNKEEDIIRNENAFPAIITKEQFNDIQKLLDSRIKKSPGNKIENYLLVGKIICGECQSSYVGERKTKRNGNNVFYRTYYRCKGSHTSKGKIIKTECHNCCIRRDEIESFVLKQISELVFSEKNFDRIFDFYNAYKQNLYSQDGQIVETKKAIEQTNKKISNLYDAITELGFRPELKEQLISLERTRENLSDALKKAQSYHPPKLSKEKLYRAYETLSKQFNCLSQEKKQTLIDIFLNKVIVYSDRVEIYLNVLPSILCEDYGLDIDIGMIKNKKEGDNLSSSLPINKNCEHNSVSTKILGSPSRARTYNLPVNSRLLHH